MTSGKAWPKEHELPTNLQRLPPGLAPGSPQLPCFQEGELVARTGFEPVLPA